MRLGGKMHNGVNLFLQKSVGHQIGSGDISLDELEVGEILQFTKIFQATAIIQAVIDDNVVLRIFLAQQNGDMGTDKACRSK
jgi:hypothetical protein